MSSSSVVRAPCRSCSPTVETSPVPPSQSLGVLCFPLSPSSRKGATHSPDGRSSFPACLARLSYHSYPSWKIPTPHKQSVKSQIWQCNVTLTVDPPFFLIFPFFYRILEPPSFPKSHLNLVLIKYYKYSPLHKCLPSPSFLQ